MTQCERSFDAVFIHKNVYSYTTKLWLITFYLFVYFVIPTNFISQSEISVDFEFIEISNKYFSTKNVL